MPPPDRRPTGVFARTAILLGAMMLLASSVRDVWPWISDDAFISLRYAERFLVGQGLTWTDGERVEGYSNLLWILLSCAMRSLGLDWITIVRGLGLLATVATLWTIVQTRWLRNAGLAPLLMAATLGALAPTALWSIGGLETPLALLLTTLGFAATGTVLADRHERAGLLACAVAGISFALLAWTRPDGPLAGVMAGGALVLFAHQHLLRRLLLLLGPVVIAVVLQLVFRIVYYGDYVPNTAHAKVGFSAAALEHGLGYLASASVILRSLLVPATIGAVLGCLDRRLRPFTLLCVAFVLAWTVYTAAIGGDLFPLCRILLPALGPLTLLGAVGLLQLSRTRAGAGLAWALAILSVIAARLDARLDPADPYQQISTWEWRGKATGEWLGRAFGEERPLLAIDAAGGVPFYSDLPCLDMLGLNDRHIAKAPLPYPEHVLPGHSRGDGKYVLDRAPDLVLFASPTGDPSPRWPGGWQMEVDPRFLENYRCVVCRTGPVDVVGAGTADLKLTLWVRLTGKVGLTRSEDGWVLPGYLLGAHRQPVPLRRGVPDAPVLEGAAQQQVMRAGLELLQWWNNEACVGVLAEDAGAVAAEFREAGTVVLEHLPLPAGDYTVTAQPTDAPIDFELVAVENGFDLRATVRRGATLPIRVHAVRITPE